MRITQFEIDGNVFDTFKEAKAFRDNPDNGLDSEFPIRTVLYENESNKNNGIESIDFSACGTDWEESEWLKWYSSGLYKGQIGDGIYVQEDDEEISEVIYKNEEVLE